MNQNNLNTTESIDYLKSLGNDAERFSRGSKDGIEHPKSICDIRHILCAEVENYQQYQLRYNEVGLGDTVDRIALFKDGIYEPYFYKDKIKLLYCDGDLSEYTEFYNIP